MVCVRAVPLFSVVILFHLVRSYEDEPANGNETSIEDEPDLQKQFATLKPKGKSVKCWVCSSDVDRRCGDPFNMTHLAVIDCDRDRAQSPYLQGTPKCKKTKQRVNDDLITVRSCTWETDDATRSASNGPCSDNAGSSYAKVEYCSVCDTDACNGADSLTISAVLHGLMPLFAAISVSRYLSAEN